MTRQSSILHIFGYLFTHEKSENMHGKSLSQGLNVKLTQPGHRDPKAKSLPLEHNPTLIKQSSLKMGLCLFLANTLHIQIF